MLFFLSTAILVAVALIGCGGGGAVGNTTVALPPVPTPENVRELTFDTPSDPNHVVTYYMVSALSASPSSSDTSVAIKEGKLNPGRMTVYVPEEINGCVICLFKDETQRKNSPPSKPEYQTIVIFQ